MMQTQDIRSRDCRSRGNAWVFRLGPIVGILFLALFVPTSSAFAAASPVDIPMGSWTAELGEHGSLNVMTSAPHRMEWSEVEHSRDTSGIRVTGSYKVTGRKASNYVVRFNVENLEYVGYRPHGSSRRANSASLLGSSLKVGDRVQLLMNFAEKSATVAVAVLDHGTHQVIYHQRLKKAD